MNRVRIVAGDPAMVPRRDVARRTAVCDLIAVTREEERPWFDCSNQGRLRCFSNSKSPANLNRLSCRSWYHMMRFIGDKRRACVSNSTVFWECRNTTLVRHPDRRPKLVGPEQCGTLFSRFQETARFRPKCLINRSHGMANNEPLFKVIRSIPGARESRSGAVA